MMKRCRFSEVGWDNISLPISIGTGSYAFPLPLRNEGASCQHIPKSVSRNNESDCNIHMLNAKHVTITRVLLRIALDDEEALAELSSADNSNCFIIALDDLFCY